MASSPPRRPTTSPLDRVLRFFTFEGRVPGELGLLLSLVVVVSVVGAIVSRAGGEGLAYVVLWPAAVLHGEVWRLLSWGFVAVSVFDVFFTCFALYFFGRELAGAFGPRRFLGLYVALAVLVGTLTSALAFAWPPLGGALYGGASAMVTGMVVAWGSLYPDREMYLFVFRVPGRSIIWISLAVLIVVVAYEGVAAVVPHLLAIALAFLYVNRRRLDWASGRAKNPKRPSHLHVVRGEDRLH